MFRAIIIDDEPLARSLVKEYLSAHSDIQVIEECNDGFEGVKAIMQLQPDLLFLDVQMPKINGFEMLELIENRPHVIFTTAFDEHAIRAFENHAIDYLLKPFSRERFDSSVNRFRLLASATALALKTAGGSGSAEGSAATEASAATEGSVATEGSAATADKKDKAGSKAALNSDATILGENSIDSDVTITRENSIDSDATIQKENSIDSDATTNRNNSLDTESTTEPGSKDHSDATAALLQTAASLPQQSSRIVVKTNGRIKIIPASTIHYLEAADDYVKIITAEGSFLKNNTMAHFEKVLSQNEFVRIHRSYLIAVDQITRLEPYDKEGFLAILRSGASLPVSRTGYSKLKKILSI